MVPLDVYNMHKEKSRTGLIDVETQSRILVTKCVVRCLEVSSPYNVLIQQGLHRLSMLVKSNVCLVYVT